MLQTNKMKKEVAISDDIAENKDEFALKPEKTGYFTKK